MLETMRQVLENTLERLTRYTTNYLPSLIAALIFILAAWLLATLVRWVIYRIFKGFTIDKFLRQSGVAFMIDRSGRLRATRIVAESAYWGILLTGFLMGVNVFDTDLTTQMINGFVFLLPKLFIAGLILLAGAWLSQYFGRSLLVWAVNEDLPYPRRIATVARLLIMFVAIVVAADQLDFARSVFLAAFIILVGGAVLATSLALGFSGGIGLRRLFDERTQQDPQGRSLWTHL
jgi:ABC-type multidrug transport system fused ATPase/permease subunit